METCFLLRRWDTQQQLYLNLLDGVRYLVVWQPVSAVHSSCVCHDSDFSTLIDHFWRCPTFLLPVRLRLIKLIIIMCIEILIDTILT